MEKPEICILWSFTQSLSPLDQSFPLVYKKREALRSSLVQSGLLASCFLSSSRRYLSLPHGKEKFTSIHEMGIKHFSFYYEQSTRLVTTNCIILVLFIATLKDRYLHAHIIAQEMNSERLCDLHDIIQWIRRDRIQTPPFLFSLYRCSQAPCILHILTILVGFQVFDPSKFLKTQAIFSSLIIHRINKHCRLSST